jgi:outer membrane protein assembly factor BamB
MIEVATRARLVRVLAAWILLTGFGCKRAANRPPDTPVPPTGAAVAEPESLCSFQAVLTDRDDDDVSCRFDWGDGDTSGWSRPVRSGNAVQMSHAWQSLGGVRVRVQARDELLQVSDWSVPAAVAVADSHPLLWRRLAVWGDVTSPLVVSNGREYLLYFGGMEHHFYGLGMDGSLHHDALPVDPFDGGVFDGPPAYSAATGHIIVGNEEGELYAFTRELDLAWHWPGNNGGNSEWGLWGTPVVNGNHVYVPTEAEDGDMLFCFLDLGPEGAMTGSFLGPDEASVVGVPVVDTDGSVLVADEDGYLYRLGPDLDTILQRMYVGEDDEVKFVLGRDGDIFCSLSSGVYAFAGGGAGRWSVPCDGPGFPVIGDSMLYVGCEAGDVIALRLDDGGTKWTTHVNGGVLGSPVLAANGMLYVAAGENPALYGLRQSDGAIRWRTSFPAVRPGLPGLWIDNEMPGSISVLPDGNIIVPVAGGAYCVAGYPGVGLADAPWPKWQHDLHNTGCSTP